MGLDLPCAHNFKFWDIPIFGLGAPKNGQKPVRMLWSAEMFCSACFIVGSCIGTSYPVNPNFGKNILKASDAGDISPQFFWIFCQKFWIWGIFCQKFWPDATWYFPLYHVFNGQMWPEIFLNTRFLLGFFNPPAR